MQDIHDIRPPVQTGMDPLLLWGLAGAAGLVFLVTLTIVLFRRWRRGGRRKTPKTVQAEISALDSAMGDLLLLEKEITGDLRGFYFELSRILRQYIGTRFNIHCTEMTDLQFFRVIKGLPIDRRIQNRIKSFFRQAEPVKYAGMTPSEVQVKAHLVEIRDLITQVENQ